MVSASLTRELWRMRGVEALRWALVLAWVAFWMGVITGTWRVRGGNWLWAGGFSLLALAVAAGWTRWRRERLLREAALPQFLKRKLRETYPQLAQKDADLVERGLRQFFLACLRSRGRFVAMPSRAVDAMWHEFILHTRAYDVWCRVTLGRFLHHTPAEALGGDARRNDGLRRAWYWSCRDEAIDLRAPTRLPLLFAIDAKLGIDGGFQYAPDCSGAGFGRTDGNGTVHCASSFSDGSHSGDADGFGGADSSSGSGGPDGDGGCGGD